MESENSISSKGHKSDEQGERVAAKAVLGDVIWVKLDGALLWPAVVVDENAVSGSKKPDDRSMGDVLVRIYGSYEYLYVDPITCCSEFEIALKENNGCCRDIFMKSLEQDLSGQSKPKKTKSKGTSHREPKTKMKNGNSSKSSGEAKKKLKFDAKENSKRKMSKQGGTAKKLKQHTSAKEAKTKPSKQHSTHRRQDHNTSSSATTLLGESQKFSARRMKVMQTLGLSAPSGSPFHKDGLGLSI